jgi:hypothetical protein
VDTGHEKLDQNNREEDTKRRANKKGEENYRKHRKKIWNDRKNGKANAQ